MPSTTLLPSTTLAYTALGVAMTLCLSCAAPTQADPVPPPTAAADAAPSEDAAMPAPPWKLSYHDGSGNAFWFWQDAATEPVRFTTSPVTPEQSSSGIYSGGEPREGTVDAEQAEAMWRAALALRDAAEDHVVDRMKGTGELDLQTAAGEQTFIVRSGESLVGWDALVHGLVDP